MPADEGLLTSPTLFWSARLRTSSRVAGEMAPFTAYEPGASFRVAIRRGASFPAALCYIRLAKRQGRGLRRLPLFRR